MKICTDSMAFKLTSLVASCTSIKVSPALGRLVSALWSFLILLSLGWSGTTAAAVCPQTDYELSTQAEVDALGGTGCDSVLGNLSIVNSTDITNINSLSKIISIDGNLWIEQNAALKNINGLGSLIRVGGRLFISSNSLLANLDGLVNVEEVGSLEVFSNETLSNLDGLAKITHVQQLIFAGNSALTDLKGLNNLATIEGDLQIEGFAALTNIDGLASLVSVGGNIVILNNTSLTDIDGLVSLVSVGGGVGIANNARLTNIDGLANINSLGGGLSIRDSDALTNISSLLRLTRIEGDLFFGENAALTNIEGLANLTSVGGSLGFFDNAALTDIDGLTNLTRVGGGINISLNSALTNIDGLANLTSAEDYISISSNAALANIDGLANVSSVANFLAVLGNAALTNIDGLANIASVGGDLRILGNDILTNLNGLAKLASIGGYLEIDRNYNASCEGMAYSLGWPDGPPDDRVTGNIDIGSNGSGCNSVAEILASVSGPTEPNVTNAAAFDDSSIELEFNESSTADTAFPITGYQAICSGTSSNPGEAPATPLLDNTPITRALSVSGYDSVQVPSIIEVDVNITHSDPTDLYITLTTPHGTELVLWDQDSSGGEDIVGTFPKTLTPVDTLTSVNQQAMDGDWVLSVEDIDAGPLVREGVLNSWELRISEELITQGSGSPITVSGVTRGRDYRCMVAPVTMLGAFPASDAVTASVPLAPPTTPTIIATDYEDGTIRLTVLVADNGDTDITEYSASCTDGTNTFTNSSPTPTIEVKGLTNGTAYICTASATNVVGTSGASAATASITPEALPSGLPIWLLKTASDIANQNPHN